MDILNGLRRWVGLIVGVLVTLLQACVWCGLLFGAGWLGYQLRGSCEREIYREATLGFVPREATLTFIPVVPGSTIDNLISARDCLASDHDYQFEMLLDAIAWRESGGDPNTPGPCGEVGLYQLTTIYIDDINRILQIIKPGVSRVSYEDRYDPLISRVCVEIYTGWYARPERLGWFPTLEDVARIHNGGPDGYKKDCTKQYWLDVKKIMERWQ